MLTVQSAYFHWPLHWPVPISQNVPVCTPIPAYKSSVLHNLTSLYGQTCQFYQSGRWVMASYCGSSFYFSDYSKLNLSLCPSYLLVSLISNFFPFAMFLPLPYDSESQYSACLESELSFLLLHYHFLTV